MADNPLDELLVMVQRELGATTAQVVEPGDSPADPRPSVSCDLPDGRRLVAYLPEPPSDRAVCQRRLELLTSSFTDLLTGEPARRPSRPPPGHSLNDELAALTRRAGAMVAVVIDAHSPVIWGASTAVIHTLADNPRNLLLQPRDLTAEFERLGLTRDAPIGDTHHQTTTSSPSVMVEHESSGRPAVHGKNVLPRERSHALAAERAVATVRALPALGSLNKGRHLHYEASGPEGSVLARSFAAIYVLILAFEGETDELRARRAVQLSLPTIERLVLALPPLEPAPGMGGAAAIRLRSPRRR